MNIISCLTSFFALSGLGWKLCEPEESIEGVYCLCRGQREKCERAAVIEAACPVSLMVLEAREKATTETSKLPPSESTAPPLSFVPSSTALTTTQTTRQTTVTTTTKTTTTMTTAPTTTKTTTRKAITRATTATTTQTTRKATMMTTAKTTIMMTTKTTTLTTTPTTLITTTTKAITRAATAMTTQTTMTTTKTITTGLIMTTPTMTQTTKAMTTTATTRTTALSLSTTTGQSTTSIVRMTPTDFFRVPAQSSTPLPKDEIESDTYWSSPNPSNLSSLGVKNTHRPATPVRLMKLSIGSGFILAFLVGCLVLLTVWQLEKRRSRRSRMSYCLRDLPSTAPRDVGYLSRAFFRDSLA